MTLSFSSYGASPAGFDLKTFYRNLNAIRAIPWDQYSDDVLYTFFEDSKSHKLDGVLLQYDFPIQRILHRYSIDDYLTLHAYIYNVFTPEQLMSLSDPQHAKRFIDYMFQQNSIRSGILRTETDWSTFYLSIQERLQCFPCKLEEMGNYIITCIQEKGGTIDIAAIPHTEDIHILPSEAFLCAEDLTTEIELAL